MFDLREVSRIARACVSSHSRCRNTTAAYYLLGRDIKRRTGWRLKRTRALIVFGVHYGYKLVLSSPDDGCAVKAYLPGVLDSRSFLFCEFIDRLRFLNQSCSLYEERFRKFVEEKRKALEPVAQVKRDVLLHGTSEMEAMPYYAPFFSRPKGWTKDKFDSLVPDVKKNPTSIAHEARSRALQSSVIPYPLGPNLPQLKLEEWHHHLKGGHKLVLIPDSGRKTLWAYQIPWPGVPQYCEEQMTYSRATVPSHNIIGSWNKNKPGAAVRVVKAEHGSNACRIAANMTDCNDAGSVGLFRRARYPQLTSRQRSELRSYALQFGERKPSSIWHPHLGMYCDHGYA